MSIIFKIIIFLCLFLTSSVKNVSAYYYEEGNVCGGTTKFCGSNSKILFTCSYSSSTDMTRITTVDCQYGCSNGYCVTSSSSVLIDTYNNYNSNYCYHSDGTSTYIGNCYNGLRCNTAYGFATYYLKDDTCCAVDKVVSDNSMYCVNGCRQISTGNAIGYGTYSSSSCFITNTTNCTLGGDLSAHATGNSCSFDTTSYCKCTDNVGWEKFGTGCHQNGLNCNNTNGWYKDCTAAWGYSSSNCDTTSISCSPCGNSAKTCYKKRNAVACSYDWQCGDPCLICSGSCVANPACSTNTCTYQNNTDKNTCLNWGGTCDNPANYARPLTNSGLCNGGSDCVCVKEDPSCQASTAANAATCAAWGGSCGSTSRFNSPVTKPGLCTGGSECVCSKEGCTPSCASSNSYCPTQTFSDGCTGTCTGTKAVIVNDLGTCGTAQTNGTIFSNPPTTNLCADGDTPSAVSTSSSTTYNWTCTGVAGSCVTAENITSSCTATRDIGPSLSSFEIRNTDNIGVASDVIISGSGRNHICQPTFTNTSSPTTARFVVTYNDPQGSADIGNIRLKIGSQIFDATSTSVSGLNKTAIFNIDKSQISSSDLQDISTIAPDVHTYPTSSDFIDTNRDFKFWDCLIATSGTGYDGSSTSGTCSNANSFITPLNIGYSLFMDDKTTNLDSDHKTMTVTGPSFTSNSNNLVWNRSYWFSISQFNAAIPQLKINGSCTNSSGVQFNSNIADPYSNPVALSIDFTSILNQEPWWRTNTNNGGVVSNTIIQNRVPVTCSDPINCRLTANGFVSAPSIRNTGKTVTGIQSWIYGDTTGGNSNNLAKLVNSNNYAYFLDNYYSKNSVGIIRDYDTSFKEVMNDGSGLVIGATGVYFVKNLIIDDNKIVPPGSFLMVVVNGDITVNPDVTRVDGIYVASNISTVNGINSTPLTFNGSLYAFNSINFSGRSLGGNKNNTAPSVIVNHNPQFLFNIPGGIAKVLSNWQWGN